MYSISLWLKMCQSDIYQVLKSNPDKWFDNDYFMKKFKIGRNSVNHSIAILVRMNIVEKKIVNKNYNIVSSRKYKFTRAKNYYRLKK